MTKHPDPFTEAKGYNGPVMLIRADDDQVDEETCLRYAQGGIKMPSSIKFQMEGMTLHL